MTSQESTMVAIDLVHSDLYCKLVLMRIEHRSEAIITERDLAYMLGLLQSAMKHLGDERDHGPYPGNVKAPNGVHKLDS